MTVCASAGNVLLVATRNREILAYDAATGVFLKVFVPPTANPFGPTGLAFGADRNLYVSFPTTQVLKFDGNSGASLGFFTGGSPLNSPSGLTWASDGNLYVANEGSILNAVVKLSKTGAVLGTYSFPPRIDDTVERIASGPLGGFYATSPKTHRVLSFDTALNLVTSFGAGSGLFQPGGIAVSPNGSVYVSSTGTNQILLYAADGRFIRVFASGPPVFGPLGLAFGPESELYVGTSTNEILKYDFNGILIARLVAPGGGGLVGPIALAVSPFLAPPDTRTITSVSGDAQEISVNGVFKDSLTVEVKAEGSPLVNQPVQFAITSGTGFLTDPNSITGANGRASTRVIAGNVPGNMIVSATSGPVSTRFTLNVLPALGNDEPVISSGGVLHGARKTPTGLENFQIAQGGIFELSGKNLGPEKRIDGTEPYLIGLPDAGPASTFVRLIGADKSVSNAFIVSASAGKIVAIAPSGAPLGDVFISASYLGRLSRQVKATVVASNFGIFTRNQLGNGPAVTLRLDVSGDYTQVGLASPAQTGQIVSVRGTGLGAIAGADNGGSSERFDMTGFEVLFGGAAVPALFGGRVPGSAGTDEIRFEIPDGVPDGCYVPVALRRGNWVSNFATIPKMPAGWTGGCEHPLKLTSAALTSLDAGGAITAGLLGIIRLSYETEFGTNLFTARGGAFGRFDSNSLFLPGGIITTALTAGSCTVFQSTELHNHLIFPVPLGQGLDAGPSLALVAPNLGAETLPRRSSGAYERSGLNNNDAGALPKDLQGQWTFSGPGGSDIASFRASLDLPPPILWTNKADISLIDRERDLTITWQTDGESRYERVLISGASILQTDNYPNGIAAQFSCSAPFDTGFLTVPRLILRQLPSTADGFGFLIVTNSAFEAGSKAFVANTINRPPIDGAAASYVLGVVKSVDFR